MQSRQVVTCFMQTKRDYSAKSGEDQGLGELRGGVGVQGAF